MSVFSCLGAGLRAACRCKEVHAMSMCKEAAAAACLRLYRLWQHQHQSASFDAAGSLSHLLLLLVLLMCCWWQGTVVAVKRLLSSDAATIERFVGEVIMLARIRHPNLILFIGFCTTPELCIVQVCRLQLCADAGYFALMVITTIMQQA